MYNEIHFGAPSPAAARLFQTDLTPSQFKFLLARLPPEYRLEAMPPGMSKSQIKTTLQLPAMAKKPSTLEPPAPTLTMKKAPSTKSEFSIRLEAPKPEPSNMISLEIPTQLKKAPSVDQPPPQVISQPKTQAPAPSQTKITLQLPPQIPTEQKPQPQPQPQPQIQPQPQPIIQAQPQVQARPEAQPQIQARPQSQPQPIKPQIEIAPVKPQVQIQVPEKLPTKPESKPEPKPEQKSTIIKLPQMTLPQTQAPAEVQPQPKPQVQEKMKTEPKPEPKPQKEPEKPIIQAIAQPQPKPQVQEKAKPELKPEPKPEPKPQKEVEKPQPQPPVQEKAKPEVKPKEKEKVQIAPPSTTIQLKKPLGMEKKVTVNETPTFATSSSSKAYRPPPGEGMKKCYEVLQKLKKHMYASPFLQPVNEKALGITDYYQIIKHPMDLGTVEKKLKNEEYAYPTMFGQDIRQIWRNAMIYNAEGSPIYNVTLEMSAYFERLFKDIEATYPPPPPEKEPYDIDKKVRKLCKQMQGLHHKGGKFTAVDSQSSKYSSVRDVPMTPIERKALYTNVHKLPSAYMRGVWDIVNDNIPSEKRSRDVVEFDLETLPVDIMRKLERFVDYQTNIISRSEQRKSEMEVEGEKERDEDESSESSFASESEDGGDDF